MGEKLPAQLAMLRSLLVSALAVCSASASPVERNDCPDGSFSVQGSCYYFSPQSVNWFEAQEYCWMMGGYLAELATQQEEYAVQQYLPAGNHYWIGLNDQAQEGEQLRTDIICDIGRLNL